MKPVAMFVLGAALAAGLVYVVMDRDQPAAAVPTQTAQQALPQAAAPAQSPEANPEAAAPAVARPTPAAEAPPARKPSPIASNRPERPAKRAPEKRTEPPATLAQNTPPAAQLPAPTPTTEVQTPTPVEPPKAVVEEPKPEPRVPKTVTIPSGTLFTVRIDEALSSDRNQQGDSFRATLDQPLVIDGFVIAERGSKVEGRVAEIDEGGRVKGVSRMALELVRLSTADGQRVKLQTESFAKQGERSRGKDLAKVGAAAGIGAAIGAIAGGGKGAAIGAAVGGAAGGGGVMATRGEPVRLPAETRVSFRLSQPITITEKL